MSNSNTTSPTTFITIAVVAILATIGFISGGVFNVTTLTAIPIIFCAEGIVFVLLYATIYHSAAEGSEHQSH